MIKYFSIKFIIVFLFNIFPIITNSQKIQILFHNNGTPEELTVVDSSGVRIGYSNIYNEKGVLIMSLMYKNGIPNGQWSRHDKTTGQLKETFIYVNGKLNGEHCWYDQFGKIVKIVFYRDGSRLNLPQIENSWNLEIVPDESTIDSSYMFTHDYIENIIKHFNATFIYNL